MKIFIKVILKYLGLFELAAFLSTYSPVQLIKALQVRKRYESYYKHAKSKYIYPQKKHPALDAMGIIKINKALTLDASVLNYILNAFKEGRVISYSFGCYQDGFISNSEYYYLKKEEIVKSGIINNLRDSEIIQILEQHLGCYIRIINFCIFKNIAQSFSNRGSFIWHRDSQPANSYKLIVYLTDTDESNGAFKYIEKSHLSYKNLPQFGNSRLRSESLESGTLYEGEVGDGVLFNINGYHLGGRVLRNERIVAVIHFKPSVIPCFDHLNQFGFGSVTEQEFGINPWKAWWAWSVNRP